VILDQIDYDSVRRAIDVTLDDGVEVDDDRILPDRVIGDPIYAVPVDAEIFAALPSAYPWDSNTLTGSQKETVRRAAVYLTAARVYPRIPMVTQEQIGSEHRYRREYESVADVVVRLRGEAFDILQPLIDLLGPVSTINVSRFRRAPAYRGRVC